MRFLKSYLYNDKPMTAKDYKISKTLIIINGAALCCSSNFIGNSYFAGLLKYMGASEILSNFILSLAPFAGIFLILVPYITSNLKYKKPFITLLSFFEYFPLAMAFFLPFISGNTKHSIIIAATLFVFHSIIAQLKTPPYQELLLNCAAGDKSGSSSFFGFKDGIANVILIITYLSLGIITKYCVDEKEGIGYAIMGMVAIITWLISIIAQFGIKEPTSLKTENIKVNIFNMIKEMLGYNKYKPYFSFQVLFNIATYSINSLLYVMCVQRLGMKLEYLSYFTMLDLIVRTFLAAFFGKLADKIGTKPVMCIGLIAFSVNAISHLFMNPGNAYLFKGIASLASGIAWSAYSAPSFVYMFESMPKNNTSGYIACHNILMLLLATLVSMISASFIDIATGFSFSISGVNFNEMNIVFLFATIIFVWGAIYLCKNNKKSI